MTVTSLAVWQEGPWGLSLSLCSGGGLPVVRVLVFVLAPGSWESISALCHLFPSCAVRLCASHPSLGWRQVAGGEK